MLFLVSNDDGIDATGIKVLEQSLSALGKVVVCAPKTEQSAKSHSFSMHEAIRVTQHAENRWAVWGTPADSVYLGIHHFCQQMYGQKPDLVVSGINRGTNLGTDVHYSGTVAAAQEGAFSGIPSLAVSLKLNEGEPPCWELAGRLAHRIAEKMLGTPNMPSVCLNLNVPAVADHVVPDIRWAKLGARHYHPLVEKREDPRGRAYYWVGGHHRAFCNREGTDGRLFSEGHATLTPLTRDLTDEGVFQGLADVVW